MFINYIIKFFIIPKNEANIPKFDVPLIFLNIFDLNIVFKLLNIITKSY